MTIRLVNTDRSSIDAFARPTLEFIGKPTGGGLWYDVGNGWVEWAIHEYPQIIKPHLFEIDVDESRILRLANLDEAIQFTLQYGDGSEKSPRIHWERVAKDWAGIEVTQECYEAQMSSGDSPNKRELQWLNGWDAASGYLWDSSAIKTSRKIPPTDPRVERLKAAATAAGSRQI